MSKVYRYLIGRMYMKKFLSTLISILVLAAALFLVIHFIWSDLYIAEFDSDDAEIVVWGEVTLETGLLADPDFRDYMTLIPVGGNLFFAPFVKIFGLGITAQRAGYTAFAVLFAALLVLTLRALLPSWNLAMIGSGLILIFTTATGILRDVFWAHSVYYGTSVFFILMCFCSLALYMRGKRVIGGILFFLGALLGSINGNVVLFYSAMPLAAALFLESAGQKHVSESFLKIPFLLICAAIVCGLGLHELICSEIYTTYTDAYEQIVPISKWFDNLRLLPERWLRLFLDLPDENVSVISPVGIKLVLRLGTALVLSIIPFFSFALLKDTESRLTRVVILYHWVLCAELMFFFIFGMISNVSWRLMPLWFSCMLVDWLTLMRMLKGEGFLRIAGAAAICLMVMFAGMTAVSVPRKPADLSIWYGNDSIYNILETHGLTQGYSTDYWYTNSVMVLSESRIKVLGVYVTDDGFEIAGKQSKGEWYKEVPSDERTFLICFEREVLQEHPWLEDEAVEVYRSTQYTPHYGRTDGFFVLVYDHDVIAEKMQESASADAGAQIREN